MSVFRCVGRAASVVTAVLALGVLAACGGGESEARRAASADIKVTLGQALSPAEVARIHVEVHAPDISTAVGMDLVRTGSTWNGTLEDIPAGPNRTFLATAYDAASTVLYAGQAGPMTLQPGRVAAVFVLMQQVNPPPPFENEAPIIDSLAVSTNEVEPGASVTLVAAAHDNNPGDTLTYAWSAAGGTFSAPAAASTTWTAPATAGVQRLQLEVRDSRNATATVTVDLTVRAGGTSGRAAVTVRLNTWPEVSAMMGAPSVLSVGGTTQLAASVTDPDGDALGFYWTSTCEGTFGAIETHTPTFTLSAMPADARCVFTVFASDAMGGFHSGNLTLQVGSGPRVNMQRVPVVDSVSQSAEQADMGELVMLALTAHDPEGTALRFSWVAPVGTLVDTQSSDGSTSARWVAPACFDGPTEVTAIITDASGATTDVAFTIRPWFSTPCGPQTVLGHGSTHYVQEDGSIIARPTDLSSTFIVAWVPTAEGSYTRHDGRGLLDGTFVIDNVESTPYLLQVGSTYYWTRDRTPDLGTALAGRADLEPEPSGTLFNLDLDGLNPWNAQDDLQVSAFGAGLTYFGEQECTSPKLGPVVGATELTGTTGYDTSLTTCGNRVGRIDLSRGDTVHVAQLVTRPTAPWELDRLREVRRSLLLSSGSPGGSVVSGGGAVTVTGTLVPQPTVARTVQISASEYEAMLLAAHPRATLRNSQTMTVGALPAFMRFGTYAGWLDLARGEIFTSGRQLVTQELAFVDPFPATWTRYAANFAEGSMTYSVPLADGSSSVPAAFRFTVYAHGPFPDGSPLVLSPLVGPPRNVRLNGQDATVDGLRNLGSAPLVTWEAPLRGSATSYTVRLYRLSASSTNETRRTQVAVFITTDAQLRLPPGLLVPGRHYHLQVQANLRTGGDVSSPAFDAPWSSNASAFTGRFQP